MKKQAYNTAADVIAALAKRYEPPAWAFLEQVADGTGSNQSRWADAVAMSVWPSRGLDVHGFEVKVSRYDLLNELKNPIKSEAVMKYCDYWWVVLGSPDIIQPGELPPTWGQLSMHGSRLMCDTQAPRLTPIAIDRTFVASVLRNFKKADSGIVEAAKISAYEEGYKRGVEEQKRIAGGLPQRVADFERASGISIGEWNAGDIGAAVRTVLDVQVSPWKFKSARDAASEIVEHFKAIEAALPGYFWRES